MKLSMVLVIILKLLSSNMQVIITAVSLNNFSSSVLSRAKIFKIENGKINIKRGEFNEWRTLWCFRYSSVGGVGSS